MKIYQPDSFEVEFVTAAGKTQALLTLRACDIRHVEAADILPVADFAYLSRHGHLPACNQPTLAT